MKRWILVAIFGITLAGCSQTNTNLGAGTQTETTASASPDSSPDVMDGANDLANQAGEAVDEAANSLSMNAQVKTVTLQAQNNSGQSGTAVLTELNDSTVSVVLNMNGGNFTQPQPAHIHIGACPNPGAVQYPLSNVMNGKSETTLNVNMEKLLSSSQTLAINVHKSAAESSVYTACGNLK